MLCIISYITYALDTCFWGFVDLSILNGDIEKCSISGMIIYSSKGNFDKLRVAKYIVGFVICEFKSCWYILFQIHLHMKTYCAKLGLVENLLI